MEIWDVTLFEPQLKDMSTKLGQQKSNKCQKRYFSDLKQKLTDNFFSIFFPYVYYLGNFFSSKSNRCVSVAFRLLYKGHNQSIYSGGI